MVARLNFRNWKPLQRIVIFFLAIVLATFSVFSFSIPKKTNADVLALGVAGALVALTASYFAVAGIQLTNNGGDETYFSGFINDTINKYKQADADHKAMVEQYFDDDGKYIGTEDELQFVLSDQAYGYWQMGKGVNSLMEDIKEWFVNTFSLDSTSQVFDFTNGLSTLDNFTIPFVISHSWNSAVSASEVRSLPFYLPAEAGKGFYYQITEDYAFGLHINSVDTSGYRFSITYVVNENGAITTTTTPYYYNVGRDYRFFFLNYQIDNASSFVVRYGGYDDYYQIYSFGFDIPLSGLNNPVVSQMSLDGVLTDGYDDFQNALDEDLANEQDNDKAVVQVCVGELEGLLNPDDAIPAIIDKAVDNVLDPTYEGVYENQNEATEDKEGEKPFTPTLPDGWVAVTGLQSFFPFCIPWDFFSVVSLFNATPEAPYFEWNMSFNDLFDDYKIVIDFSDYELPATILRTMLVIVFLIFLIRKTRSWIRG